MNTPDTLRRADQRFHLHPFTQHEELHALGTHILVEGRGVFLRDSEGRQLLDGLAGLWCVNVGYGCSEIVEAVHAQMQQLAYYPSFFNSTTEPAILLAEKLAALAPPGMGHTLFSNSGSEANETALKLIRTLMKHRGTPGKTKILSREFAYHGVTLGTTSLTGLASCSAPFDLPLPGFVHVPGPHAYAANREDDPAAYGQWCLEQTERILERENPDTIAAIFVEPVQGAGGVIVPPPGYLQSLRALARQHDILFVADEVITAFGRVGDWFASGLWELEPDLITLAKGLTSGYLPLGATMVRDEWAELLIHGGPLRTVLLTAAIRLPAPPLSPTSTCSSATRSPPRFNPIRAPIFREKYAPSPTTPPWGRCAASGSSALWNCCRREEKRALTRRPLWGSAPPNWRANPGSSSAAFAT